MPNFKRFELTQSNSKEWVTVQEAVFEDEEDVIGAGTESAHPVEVEENETLKKLIERIVKQNLTPAGRVVGTHIFLIIFLIIVIE